MHAVIEYNKSIHSVTGRKPIDTLHDNSQETQQKVRERIEKAQLVQNCRLNQDRQNRVFDVGERVLVKTNRRLGNKLTPLCTEEKVEADLGTTVLIKGRVVHKDNLR